ncbi:MAG: hypothetical protein GY943_10390, partial [Chloroflexi bacterium]|nr:hypothetical protein [Chloroflexota bacterium]
TAVHLPPQQTIPPDPYDPTYNQLPTAENSLSPQNRRWGLIGGGIVLALLVCGIGGWLLVRFAGNLFTTETFDPLPTPAIDADPTAETAVADPTATSPPIAPITTADVTAVRLNTPPTVDGNLSDWSNAAPVSIPFRTYQHESWDGSEDVTAVWQLGWDDNNLYIGVTIIDDVLAQNQSGNQLFRGDSASLQIDTSNADDGQTNVNTDDYQLDFSPGNFDTLPPAVFRFRGTDANQMLDALGHSIQIQATQTADGYILEGAISWLDLDTRPQAGQVMGVALNVTDNDQVGTAVQETFYSHVSTRTFRDPTTWGTLTLAP